MTSNQFSLFPDSSNPWNIPVDKDPYSTMSEEISALDEMLQASLWYRSSREYMTMLNFICRFPKYSPFNCFLLYTQNPAVSYVATAKTWRKKFGRWPKRDSRPLVILAPHAPVIFVYDLKDTEGKPVPDGLQRPFLTKGYVPEHVINKMMRNCSYYEIELRAVLLKHRHGGSVVRLDNHARSEYYDLNLDSNTQYLVILNKELTLEDKYSSLAHELAHIFCGHLGSDEESFWPDRQKLGKKVVEIEAESVAYLVCRRRDLHLCAEKYLSGYIQQDKELPPFSLDAVLKATKHIEEMGKKYLDRPRTKKSTTE